MRSKSAHSRVTQLDGLRGIAALVVVACHVMSTLPGIGSRCERRPVRGTHHRGGVGCLLPAARPLERHARRPRVLCAVRLRAGPAVHQAGGGQELGPVLRQALLPPLPAGVGVPGGGRCVDCPHSPVGVAAAELLGGHVRDRAQRGPGPQGRPAPAEREHHQHPAVVAQVGSRVLPPAPGLRPHCPPLAAVLARENRPCPPAGRGGRRAGRGVAVLSADLRHRGGPGC